MRFALKPASSRSPTYVYPTIYPIKPVSSPFLDSLNYAQMLVKLCVWNFRSFLPFCEFTFHFLMWAVVSPASEVGRGSWSYWSCNWGVSHRNPIIMCNQYFCCSRRQRQRLMLKLYVAGTDVLDCGSIGDRVVWSYRLIERTIMKRFLRRMLCCLFSSILSNFSGLISWTSWQHWFETRRKEILKMVQLNWQHYNNNRHDF